MLWLMVLIASCSPRVSMKMIKSLPPQAETSKEVIIIDPSIKVPEEYRIGHIKVSPRFFSTTKQCTYDKVLQLAKQRTKNMGGNALFITYHHSPDKYTGAHRIKADVLMLPDEFVSFSKSGDTHPDYASIWLYRYPWGEGCEYDVYMGEKWVFWSRPNTKTEIRVHDDGEYVFWAKIEKKVSLCLQVEKGKDYYIETNIWGGIITPNPLLFTVSDYAGKDACAGMELVKEEQ